MKKTFVLLALIALIAALAGCRPAAEDQSATGDSGAAAAGAKGAAPAEADGAASTGASGEEKGAAKGKSYVADIAGEFDWDAVHPGKPVSDVYAWDKASDGFPRLAALNATGSAIFVAAKSADTPDGSTIYVVDGATGKERKVFDVDGTAQKLYTSDTGNVVFVVTQKGGTFYSLTEEKVWALMDYDNCKSAVGIGPRGMTLTCWGGGTGSIYHYDRHFNLQNAFPFWGEPLPSKAEDAYGEPPVMFFPALGTTQIIIQFGDKPSPKFAFLSLNTSQHTYTRYHASTEAYLVGGVVNKSGDIFRALLAPPANYKGMNPAGDIPLTLKATIDLNTMDYSTEPIKPIASIPLAMDRAGEKALVRTGQRSMGVVNLKDGTLLSDVPAGTLGDFVFVGAAGDLGGALVLSEGKLKWVDLTRFPVKR